MTAVDSVHPRHRVAVDLSTKRQNAFRLGAKDDVMAVDPAVDAAFLVRSLETPRKMIAVVVKGDVVLHDFIIPRVLGVNGPVARDIVRASVVGLLRGSERDRQKAGERQ